MAATVTIRRWTGSSGAPTKTDITGINTRANAEDAHSTAGTSNPIQIPSSGTNYSFWVSTQLSADTTPSGTIDNLRWYTDGSNNFGTGVTCKMNTASAYVQATGTAGTTGDILNTTNHTSLAGATSDCFGFTSGSPKTLTGSISNPSTGDIGHQAVYQLEVADTAGPGATSQETFTWKYDET